MNLKRADLPALERSNFSKETIVELQSYCRPDDKPKSNTCLSCKAALVCAVILTVDVVRLVVTALLES